jgi:hypothetical protein
MSLPCAAAAVLAAGVGQAQVVNDEFHIVDKNESEASAHLDASNLLYEAHAVVICSPASMSDGAEGSSVRFEINHIDKANISKNKAQVAQKKNGNPVDVQVITGGGAGENNARLTCEKATLDVSVTPKSDTGKFKGGANNCFCDENENTLDICNTYRDRLPQVFEDCDELKSASPKPDSEGGLKSLTIKGKGPAGPAY